VEQILVGVDPGFDFNPGEVRQRELTALAEQRVKTLPADLRVAATKTLAAQEPVSRPPRFIQPVCSSGVWRAGYCRHRSHRCILVRAIERDQRRRRN
jgi:hypothetical protein